MEFLDLKPDGLMQNIIKRAFSDKKNQSDQMIKA